MSEAPLPPNEAQRLDALYALHILDTPAEERFDRITRLATQMFDVPDAHISLVDANRQWLKSRQRQGSRETSRRTTFCTHAILERDVLIIPNALRDPRFADNPLVTGEPHIRFYAGCVLRSRDGYALGTLCLIDQRPRQLSEASVQSLRDLAVWAEQELNTIELTAANEALREEVTERRRVEAQLQRQNSLVQLLQTVAIASNTATSIDDATQTCLREICTYAGWSIGHAYLPAEDGSADFVSTSLWYLDDGERYAAFRAATEALRFQLGRGVVGRVAASHAPLEIAQITDAPDFQRRTLIEQLGIERGIAVPMLVGDEVWGVLEFFSTEAAETEPLLLDLLLQIGAQLAWVVKRQRAEVAFQKTAERLARSHRELEDFTTIASHDLQEPLRKIRAFGDLIVEQYGAALDAEGRDYLDRMHKASIRMQTLIDDLLALSRLERLNSHFAPVDLGQVAREVLLDLEARIAETGGRVEIGALPVIEADALQMRQLFQNVLGNALKFHRPDAAPHVRLESRIVALRETASGSHTNPVYCELSIADNGIGFDEKYLDRIFAPFQRLHGRSAYEGTGMGLAICRKIVVRHGGTITARSTPGRGTTFLIALPLGL